MNAKLTLPVTDAIEALLSDCNHTSRTCYVRQLWLREKGTVGRKPKATNSKGSHHLNRIFTDLRRKLGLERRFVPHDLRRTAAVGMLEATGDIRDVQALLGHRNLNSTLWYLDHDLRPVSRSTLELIKGKRTNHPKEEKTA